MRSATEILKSRRKSSFVLTPEFAARIRSVVQTLPPETMIGDMYYLGLGETGRWGQFVATLSRTEKGALTRALISIRRKTVGEVSGMSMEELVGWKAGENTAAFLYLAFHPDEAV